EAARGARPARRVRRDLRREAREVGDVAVERRDAPDQRIADDRLGTLAGRREVGAGGGRGHANRVELRRLHLQPDVEARRLAEADAEVLVRDRRVADAARREPVAGTDFEVLNEVAAAATGEHAGREPSLPVDDLDLDVLEGTSGLVGDRAGDRARGGALR